MTIGALLGHLYRYVRPYWPIVLVLAGGLAVEAGFDTIMRVSTKILIDEAIEPRNHGLLVLLLSLLAAGAVVSSACGLACDYLWAKFGARVTNAVRTDIFEHLQRLSMDFYGRSKAGDLLTRFSWDLSSVECGLVIALPAGLLAAGGILFSAVLLFRMEWRLALVTVAGLPFCFIGPRVLGHRAIRADYRYKQEEAQVASLVQENITAQPVVKAFGLQAHAAEEFRVRLHRLLAYSVRSSFLGYLVQRVPNVSVLMLSLLVLGIGAMLAFRGSLSIGSLVAFQVLLAGMSTAVNSLTWVGPYLVSAAGGMQRIREVLDEQPRVADAPGAVPLARLRQSVVFDRVSFRYLPGQPALDEVTLELPAGWRVAIVGASGSGKSTLLNLLMRFYDPQAGRVLFDGVDIRTVTQESLRAQMAMVFQESFLFDATVRENLRVARPGATDADVEAAARAAEIHDAIMALPDGYQTRCGERGNRFSAGQRQRLAIARAFVRDPAVLLLDEATSALDPGTEAALNGALERLAEGRTVISVTHRLSSAKDAHRIVVMDRGRIVEVGTHGDLVARGGVYARLWNKQSGLSLSAAGDAADVDIGWLGRLPFFQPLDAAALAGMRSLFVTERHPEDRTIVNAGDPSETFHVIVRGRVVAERPDALSQERRRLLLGDGDYFGEGALLGNRPSPVTVRTVTPCIFLVLDREQVQKVRKQLPALDRLAPSDHVDDAIAPGSRHVP